MPIDPRIPLGVQPPQVQNPLEALSTFAQLRAHRADADVRQLAAQDAALKRARQAQVDAALEQAVSVDPDTGRITLDRSKLVGHLPGGLLLGLQKQLDDDETSANTVKTAVLTLRKAQVQHLGSIAQTVKAANYDPQLFAIHVRGAQRLGALDDEAADRLLAIQDPTQIRQLVDSFLAQAGIKPEHVTVGPDQRVIDPATGRTIAEGPAKDEKHSPQYLEWQDYQKNGGTLGFDEYMTRDANRKAPRITVSTSGDVDPVAIADAIIAGDQPPNLQGLYRYGAAVRAALAKKKYDLSAAQIDWAAAQRHFATINGPQQTRLRQAVDTAAHSLDVIDDLAGQWKGLPLPILNRANLALAKSGTYGPRAQTVAQQLEAQIADVTSELANAYMGGNSPTDHALKLAATNLRADWSEKTLKDMTALARTNLKIRQNAIRNVGAIGASDVNPYVPTPAPPPAAPPPSGAAATPAKIGERRLVNGQLAEWDGTGWKAVR